MDSQKVDFQTFHYSTYYKAAFVAPLTFLFISLTLMVMPIYMMITPLIWMEDWNYLEMIKSDSIWDKIKCKALIFGGLKLVYGHQLDRANLTICGRKMKPPALTVLFCLVIFVFCCTVVSFWSNFLVDESTRCTTNMDCFALNKTTFIAVQEEPLKENCSEYENDNNYTIHCYIFTFDYADALGDAGGVLVLATVIMNIQAGLWVSYLSRKNKCMSIAVPFYQLVVGFVLFLVLIAVIPSLSFFKDYIIRPVHSSTVQYWTYSITFLSVFSISGPIFYLSTVTPEEHELEQRA